MTQNVSELMRLLRQRAQPEANAQEEQPAEPSVVSLDPKEVTAELSPGLSDLTNTSAAGNEMTQLLRNYRLASIPVDQILIDPHQPRRTLPDDLRDACAQGRLSPREALFELCQRAQSGDVVIALRVKQLHELADNIREIGLEYPPKVTKVNAKDGSFKYRLVDGERRFWAWLLLLASAGDAGRIYRESIPALVEEENANSEDILKSQWATNLHRERVPVVDIADYVMSVRDTYASRLQLNLQPWIESLGAEGAAMSLPSAVLALTSREIAAVMGKRMSRATLFRYLAIAEKLRSDTKAIAQVRQFGLRQCEWLSRLSPSQQFEAAQHMKSSDPECDNENPEAAEAGRARISGAGRPRLVDGRITMLVRVAGEVIREKETNLRKADAVKLQELRQATTDAIDALQNYLRRIDRSLSAVTSKETSDP